MVPRVLYANSTVRTLTAARWSLRWTAIFIEPPHSWCSWAVFRHRISPTRAWTRTPSSALDSNAHQVENSLEYYLMSSLGMPSCFRHAARAGAAVRNSTGSVRCGAEFSSRSGFKKAVSFSNGWSFRSSERMKLLFLNNSVCRKSLTTEASQAAAASHFPVEKAHRATLRHAAPYREGADATSKMKNGTGSRPDERLVTPENV